VITYASAAHGGLGFQHHGHKQGIQKCLQVLKHLCTKTSIGHVFTIVLEHYQLLAGIADPVLEDTCTIPWCNAPWLNHLQQFLHHINGQIILKQPWFLSCHHQHDCYIMEDILLLNLPPQQAIQLSSVHLYLQITVLSKITNHSGIHILLAMMCPSKPSPGTTNCCNYSNLQWPAQPFPGPAAWK